MLDWWQIVVCNNQKQHLADCYYNVILFPIVQHFGGFAVQLSALWNSFYNVYVIIPVNTAFFAVNPLWSNNWRSMLIDLIHSFILYQYVVPATMSDTLSEQP